MFLKSKNIGFTTAEVLIALAALGIIIALTISVFGQTANNSSYSYTLKKAYAVLDSATTAILYKNSGSLYNVFADDDDFMTEYSNHIKFSTVCLDGESQADCWSSSYSLYDGTDGENNADWKVSNKALAVSFDGIYYGFQVDSATCAGTEITGNISCGKIIVDVNGGVGPNIFGKDIFGFLVGKDGIYASGDDGTTSSDPCYNTNDGIGCTSKVLTEEGINY